MALQLSKLIGAPFELKLTNIRAGVDEHEVKEPSVDVAILAHNSDQPAGTEPSVSRRRDDDVAVSQ